MKAPDKIVMPEATSQLRFTMTESVEYIRKDTLLEWANIMKRICKGAEPIEKAYQTMIDKIESL